MTSHRYTVELDPEHFCCFAARLLDGGSRCAEFRNAKEAEQVADVVNRAIALRDAIRAHSKAAIVIPLEVRKAMDELVAAVD